MNDTLQKAIDDLNYLIAVNSARIDQYHSAEEKVENKNLQTLFQRMDAESNSHITRLAALIQDHGGEVEKGTTLSGDLHRIWLDVKSALTGNDSKAILTALECAERSTLDAYNRILESGYDLPEEDLAIIRQQRQLVEDAHAAIERLGEEPVAK